jgi:hypothetical protein
LCSHVGGEAPSPHSEQAEPMHSSTESTDTAGFGTPRARLRLRKSTPAGAPEYQREYFLQLPRFPPSSPFWPSRAPCKQSRQTLWIPQVCFSLSRATCPREKYARWRARVPARVLLWGGGSPPPTREPPFFSCHGSLRAARSGRAEPRNRDARHYGYHRFVFRSRTPFAPAKSTPAGAPEYPRVLCGRRGAERSSPPRQVTSSSRSSRSATSRSSERK